MTTESEYRAKYPNYGKWIQPPLTETTHVYCSTYCNQGHRVSDGKPVGHECIIIPVKALHAEMGGDYSTALSIMLHSKKVYHRGLRERRA